MRRKPFPRFLASLLATGLLLSPSVPALAANTGDMVPVQSALNPLVRTHRLSPLGNAPGNQMLHLMVGLPSAHPRALMEFLATPKHSSLSPALFSQRFGPQSSARNAVEVFLQGGGLSPVSSPSTQWIEATGTVAQVESLLHTTIRTYLYRGRTVYAADSAPLVPASLAADITGIVGLNDISRPVPAGSGSGGSTATGGLTPILPTQIQTAYNLVPAYANGLKGQGVHIAIATFAPFNPQDVAHFLKRMGDTTGIGNLQIVPVDNASTAAPTSVSQPIMESTLDVEYSLVMAPAATETVFVGPSSATGFLDTYASIANAPKIQVMSTSWGFPEANASPAFIGMADRMFAQMAAEGVTVVAASGDSGPGAANLTYPASDPYVLSVGGTQVNLHANNSIRSEAAWVGTAAGGFQGDGTGGGYSGFFSMPSWQQGFLPSAATQRGVPDVALNAVGYEPYAGKGWIFPTEGTSFAAPEWAGILALADQYRAQKGLSSIGLAAPLLYSLAGAHSTLPDPFHAITQGSMNGFHAGAPWNPMTGLGSVNAWTLIQDLGQETATAPASTPRLTGMEASFPPVLAGPQVLYNQAQAGFPVIVTGANLGSAQGSVTVGGVPATIHSWQNTGISFAVPPSGPNGPWGAGTVPVQVYTASGISAGSLNLQLVNSLNLTVQGSLTPVTGLQQVTVSLVGPSGQPLAQGSDVYGLQVTPSAQNVPIAVYAGGSSQPLSQDAQGLYELAATNGTATFSVSSTVAGTVAYAAEDLTNLSTVWPSVPSPILGYQPPPSGVFLPGPPNGIALLSPPAIWGGGLPAQLTVGTTDAYGNPVPASVYGSGTFNVSFGGGTGITVTTAGKPVPASPGGVYPISSQKDGTASFSVTPAPGTSPDLFMTVTDSTYTPLSVPVLFAPVAGLTVTAPSTPVMQPMPVQVQVQTPSGQAAPTSGTLMVQIAAVGPLRAFDAMGSPLPLAPLGPSDSTGLPTYQTQVPFTNGQATFYLMTPVASGFDSLTVSAPGVVVPTPGGPVPLVVTKQLSFTPGQPAAVILGEPFPSVPVMPKGTASPSLWQQILAGAADAHGNPVPQPGQVFDLQIAGATGTVTVATRSSGGTVTVLQPKNGSYAATAGSSGYSTFLVADTAPDSLSYTVSEAGTSLPSSTVTGQFTTAMPAVLSTATVKTVPAGTYQPLTVSVLDGNGNLVTSLQSHLLLTVSGGSTVGTAVYGAVNGTLAPLSPNPQGGYILPLQQGQATFDVVSPYGQALNYTIADPTIPSLKPVVAVGAFTGSPPPAIGGGGAMGGGGGGAPPVSPTTPQVSSSAAGLKAVVPSEGGTVAGATVPVSVDIPQGAFPSGTTLSVSTLSASSLTPPAYSVVVGSAVAFSSSAGEPVKPVSATFSYDPAALNGRSPLRLGVYYLSGGSTWQYVGGTVDPTTHTVTVTLPHLSTYALLLDTRSFPDVPASFWAYGDIGTLVARHVVDGYPNGLFAPNQPVTRAEFVAMLVRALGVSAPASSAQSFQDVPTGAWEYGAVETAVSQGWIQGVSATSFDPNAPITREEAAAILARAVGPVPLTGSAQTSFSDHATIAPWASSAVQEDASLGLIRGMPGGSYDPLGIATRAQTAAMVVRLLRYENLLP